MDIHFDPRWPTLVMMFGWLIAAGVNLVATQGVLLRLTSALLAAAVVLGTVQSLGTQPDDVAGTISASLICAFWASSLALPLYAVGAFRTPAALHLQLAFGAWTGATYGPSRSVGVSGSGCSR
jgi:hypothetical protein